MGRAKLKRLLGADTAKPRVKGGKVKTLAMDFKEDNGAPTVKLDFEDGAVRPIDFIMNPITALRLFDILDRPFKDFWQKVKAADLVEAPAGRQALFCGPMADIKIKVSTATGEPDFQIKFGDDAPIAGIEFTFPPALAVALMHGFASLAQQFHWLDSLNAVEPDGKPN